MGREGKGRGGEGGGRRGEGRREGREGKGRVRERWRGEIVTAGEGVKAEKSGGGGGGGGVEWNGMEWRS